MAGEYNGLGRFHTAPAAGYAATTVTVAASGGDYTTIKAAVLAANPSAAAPVKVYVRNGTYNEIQIVGKDYLTVEGESRAGVVMVSDGLREDVDPVSGQRYVDMAQATKHGWYLHNQMTLRNMTIRVSDVKYCAHIDDTGAWTLTFDNCLLQHANGFPIGTGLKENQHLKFNNCTFEKLGAADTDLGPVGGCAGVFMHNRNNRTGSCFVTMTGCRAINCGLLLTQELGSAQADLIRLERCYADPADVRGIYYHAVPNYYNGGVADVLTVPYNINILELGCGTLPLAKSDLVRPDAASVIRVE